MYLSSKPSRLTTAKTRLNHSHKFENIEPRKRSPDGSSQSPLSPSEVIVFNNTNHTGNGGRNNHNYRPPPEVPQADEIHRYFRDVYERKMHEAKTQNLTVLRITCDPNEKEGVDAWVAGSSSSSSVVHQQQQQPKGKNSPQHSQRK